jgi:hypothetical protein
MVILHLKNKRLLLATAFASFFGATTTLLTGLQERNALELTGAIMHVDMKATGHHKVEGAKK